MDPAGSYRLYGNPPYQIILLHGGPGAPGSLAPLAQMLAKRFSLIEHLQNEFSIDAQIDSLNLTIDTFKMPVTLIGHSWGAWLGWIFAARFPGKVKKLIMIGAGPFEERYAENIRQTRMQRLTPAGRHQLATLSRALHTANSSTKKQLFGQLGRLILKADSFDPGPVEGDRTDPQPDVFASVWPEAEELRRSGRLLEMAREIRCPVAAIHGDFDPHPVVGIKQPLAGLLPDFQMITIPKCGHYPWFEKMAKKTFEDILIRLIREV